PELPALHELRERLPGRVLLEERVLVAQHEAREHLGDDPPAHRPQLDRRVVVLENLLRLGEDVVRQRGGLLARRGAFDGTEGVGGSSSSACGTGSLASGMTGTPMAAATAWPDGSPMRSPRSRFRSASEGKSADATDGGRVPRGLTSDESILYAGWIRCGPNGG